MTRKEKKAARLHAIEDAILTALYYVAVWSGYMWFISKYLKLW